MKAKPTNSKLGGIAVLATVLTIFLGLGVASADFHQPGMDCTDCHDMHGGTSNLKLIAEEIPEGWNFDPINPETMVFTEVPAHYADGSGTRICEVCHENTNYYRTDGTGAEHHLGEDCSTCHSHCDEFLHAGGSGSGCDECHGTDAGGAGTVQSHSLHTENDDADEVKGPMEDCSTCHDTNNFPYFKTGTDENEDERIDLSETEDCDACHSPGGAFDGVDDAVVGAKNNWANGAYETDGTLQDGLENWCLGCHDDNPNTPFPANESSLIGGVYAPNIAGNENNGNNYGFNLTGHGMSTFITKVDCTSCHDSSKEHLDGEPRTYGATLDNYVDGYRLGGDMNVPHEGGVGIANMGNASLCFECHNPYEVLGSNVYDLSHTNFQEGDSDWRSLHWWHFGHGNTSSNRYFDSDFDGTIDSAMTCTSCHNVHGASNSAMIRDGGLIGAPGNTLKFTYITPSGNDPYAALVETTGADMQYGPGSHPQNHICNDCHNAQLYMRTPNLNPKVLDRQATPGTVPPGEETKVLLTARVVDPNDNINTVTIDLSDIGGSASQTMYDDGNNGGDVIAGDGVFSFEATVPDTIIVSRIYYLLVTCTDHDALTSEGTIKLVVIGPNEIIIDNLEASFVGTWSTNSTHPQQHGADFRYKAAGSGSAKATWTPTIPVAGTYNVYAWWVDNDPAYRASNAPYTIYYDNETVLETVTVDQSTDGPGGGQWIRLGTYEFAAGTAGYVELSDNADNYVVADAIKWEAVGETYQISGQITDGPGGGITVQLSGALTDSTVTTGASDNYSFTVPDGIYNVTPSLTGYEFDPTFREVTVSGGNVLIPDITATAQTTLIVDNTDPEATFVGTWSTASGWAQEYGSDFRYKAAGSGSATATWTPTIPVAGTYNVYAWWVDYDPAYRASNAPYTIYYDNETVLETVTVDQSTDGPGGGQWIRLGTYEFAAGTAGYVELSDNADNYVVADAIKWEAAGETYQISGQITDGPGGGITVQLSGALTDSTVTTGASDNYSFTVPDGIYNVTPSLTGYEFDPTFREVTVSGGNVLIPDITATAQTTLIVDNTDPEATFVGTWSTASGWAQEYGSDFRYKAAGSGSATATWTPTIPVAGTYNVYAWWVDYDPAYRASNAPYTIYYDNETVLETVTVDQSTDGPGGGQWIRLGTYEFAAGTAGYVELSDNADNYVVADAIKWEAAGETYQISGQITDGPGGGITVQLSGALTDSTVTTGASDNYSFTVPDGIYNVTPSLTGYEFDPTFREVTVSGEDVLIPDITATAQTTLIVDNTDPEATFVGTWSTASGWAQEYGSDFRYKAAGSGSATATWTPTIPVAGTYNVYAWWVDNAPAYRASNAPYTIYYDNETVLETVTVDQSTDGPGGGQWIQLGTYEFAAGTAGYVELSDNADNYVVADAIKWEWQELQ